MLGLLQGVTDHEQALTSSVLIYASHLDPHVS